MILTFLSHRLESAQFPAISSQETTILGQPQPPFQPTGTKRQTSISSWIPSKRQLTSFNTPNGRAEQEPTETKEGSSVSTPKPLSLFRKASCLPRQQVSILERLPSQTESEKYFSDSDDDVDDLIASVYQGDFSRSADVSQTCPPPAPPPSSPSKAPIPVFVRTQYPGCVGEGSPIMGLGGNSILRSCFRISDTFQVVEEYAAKTTNQEILLELFAQVRSSTWSVQDGICKQHFTLVDLFHDRPLYLRAILNLAAQAKQSAAGGLLPSGRFLGDHHSDPMLCRCVGMMRRDRNQEWEMQLFAIAPVTWLSIDRVKEIAFVGSGENIQQPRRTE